MKVYSLDSNTGKYFEDENRLVGKHSSIYQGCFHTTPIYPLYTFSTNGRYDYANHIPEIEFCAMIPVKRLFGNYLIEVRFRFTISVHDKEFWNHATTAFNEFCEMRIRDINVKTLPKK